MDILIKQEVYSEKTEFAKLLAIGFFILTVTLLSKKSSGILNGSAMTYCCGRRVTRIQVSVAVE